MPELAEVYWFSRRWLPAVGRTVVAVSAPPSRAIRHEGAGEIVAALAGRTLLACASRGKQAAFRFSDGVWLGIHLGMTGRLLLASARTEVFRFYGDGETARPTDPKHDRLSLHAAGGDALIYNDPRMFGGVRLHRGESEPDWWAAAGPDSADPAYDAARFAAAVHRSRSPLKALLLRQDLAPGIGNWMADEILFQSRLRPTRRGESLTRAELAALSAAVLAVARTALATVGRGEPPPADWMFHRRWRAGDTCPATGAPLRRDTVGGRTTCWSAAAQR